MNLSVKGQLDTSTSDILMKNIFSTSSHLRDVPNPSNTSLRHRRRLPRSDGRDIRISTTSNSTATAATTNYNDESCTGVPLNNLTGEFWHRNRYFLNDSNIVAIVDGYNSHANNSENASTELLTNPYNPNDDKYVAVANAVAVATSPVTSKKRRNLENSAERARLKRRKKDSNKPKHPLTPYNIFFLIYRQRLLFSSLAQETDNGDDDFIPEPTSIVTEEDVNFYLGRPNLNGSNDEIIKKSPGARTKLKTRFHQLTQMVADAWKTIDPISKQCLQQRSILYREQYRIKMRQWREDTKLQQTQAKFTKTAVVVPPRVVHQNKCGGIATTPITFGPHTIWSTDNEKASSTPKTKNPKKKLSQKESVAVVAFDKIIDLDESNITTLPSTGIDMSRISKAVRNDLLVCAKKTSIAPNTTNPETTVAHHQENVTNASMSRSNALDMSYITSFPSTGVHDGRGIASAIRNDLLHKSAAGLESKVEHDVDDAMSYSSDCTSNTIITFNFGTAPENFHFHSNATGIGNKEYPENPNINNHIMNSECNEVTDATTGKRVRYVTPDPILNECNRSFSVAVANKTHNVDSRHRQHYQGPETYQMDNRCNFHCTDNTKYMNRHQQSSWNQGYQFQSQPFHHSNQLVYPCTNTNYQMYYGQPNYIKHMGGGYASTNLSTNQMMNQFAARSKDIRPPRTTMATSALPTSASTRSKHIKSNVPDMRHNNVSTNVQPCHWSTTPNHRFSSFPTHISVSSTVPPFYTRQEYTPVMTDFATRRSSFMNQIQHRHYNCADPKNPTANKNAGFSGVASLTIPSPQNHFVSAHQRNHMFHPPDLLSYEDDLALSYWIESTLNRAELRDPTRSTMRADGTNTGTRSSHFESMHHPRESKPADVNTLHSNDGFNHVSNQYHPFDRNENSRNNDHSKGSL